MSPEKREKQFVRSYYEDLKTDIGHLDSLLKGRKGRKKMIDSLTVMLDTPDPDVYGKKIYFNARPLTVALVFFNNDRTIQQLKNGGNVLQCLHRFSLLEYHLFYHKIAYQEEVKMHQHDCI